MNNAWWQYYGLKSRYQYWPKVFNINIVNIEHIGNISLISAEYYMVNIILGTLKPNTTLRINIIRNLGVRALLLLLFWWL